MRHLVVVEPSLSPADADLIARLAQETDKSAAEWEQLLIGSPTLARVVGGSDDVRDAHELAGKIDSCGLQARVVRFEDMKAAVSRMKEAASLERAPRSHGAFRVQLTDGATLEVTHRDLRALVSGRQVRRGHDQMFVALVRNVEPSVVIVRAPGTRVDTLVPHAHSPELALGELFTVLMDAVPRVAVERGLERPGAKSGVVEFDDLAAAVAISAWVASASQEADLQGALDSLGAQSAFGAPEQPPIDVNSLFGLPPSGPPSAPSAPYGAPQPGASLDLATEPRRDEPRRDEPRRDEPQWGEPRNVEAPREAHDNDARSDVRNDARSDAEPHDVDALVRARPARPVRAPKAASPIERVLALRTEKPAIFFGAIAAVALVVLLALFGRGTPNVASSKLGKGEAWKTPYGVTFTFDSAFDASVGGEQVVGMTVTASKGGEKESFRISGYDATRDRAAFNVAFKLSAHDEQSASWIKVEARKPQ